MTKPKLMSAREALQRINAGTTSMQFESVDNAIAFAGALAYSKGVKPIFVHAKGQVWETGEEVVDCYFVCPDEDIQKAVWDR